MTKRYRNYINGEWLPAESEATFPNLNPADVRDVIGLFPDSGSTEVNQAVSVAQKAFESWRLVPAPRRGEILYRAGQILKREKERLARLMTREMGKILVETRGDVQEAIDMAFYVAGEGRRFFGQTTTSELPNKFAMSVRMPIGVVGVITPWNFPVAIPSWKIFPALLCGNTVVFKPAEDAPASGSEFVRILERAGVPPGVVNLVHGGPATGQALVRHPHIRLVSFTGSCEVGREVAEYCGRKLKRCSLELGGKNAQIVLADADLELALEGALWGAFGTTGQRCTATSRIYVEKKLYARFTRELIRRAKRLKIGNGLRPSTQMGPLINENQHRRVHEYVKSGVQEGAKLECGGRPVRGRGFEHGFFYHPTVFTHVEPAMRIMREEIFGPVVCLAPVRDFEEALHLANDTSYGLSSSLYTRDVNLALRALRDLETGITYINGPTIGAEVHLPFGGVKNTGNGHREAGQAALDIFSEWKSVYMDYSGKLQKAQIDIE